MNFTEPRRLIGSRLQGGLINFSFNSVVISLDGQQIAFSYTCKQGSSLGIMDRDGKNATPLLRVIRRQPDRLHDDEHWYLQFTPDGRHLVYVLSEYDGQRRTLYRIDIATKEQTRLTETDAYSIMRPEISPDGHHIICESWDKGTANLCLVPLVGGEPTFLTHTRSGNEDAEYDYLPGNLHSQYSPDGMWIAFLSSDYDGKVDNTLQVCVMRSDGTDRKRLTDFAGGCGDPAWHPNGKQIAFTVHEALDAGVERTKWKYRLNIYRVNADGSGLRRLENSNCFNGSVVFSPDGHYIAYATSGEERFEEGRRNWDIRLLDTETGLVHNVTDDDLYDYDPLFHPDGKSILFLSERDGYVGIFETFFSR